MNSALRPQVPTWCDPEWRSLMESCSFITSLSKSMTFLFWFWYRSLDGYMTDWLGSFSNIPFIVPWDRWHCPNG